MTHGRFVRSLPALLTTFRLVLGPLLVLAARAGWPPWVFVAGLVLGLFSDIYDGILARRLGVATPILRRYDSASDVVFYLAILACAAILHPDAVRQRIWAISVLLLLEVLCNAVSLTRFHRPPATHCYLAKAWGLLLFATFVAILGFGAAGVLFKVMFIVGVAADLEVLSLLLIMPEAPVDIPSIFPILRRRLAVRSLPDITTRPQPTETHGTHAHHT